MHRINGPTDPELAVHEDRAEAAMVAALQQVMDTVAERVEQIRTASARQVWTGCRYCLNPRHPGPCAKPDEFNDKAREIMYPPRPGPGQS